MLSNTEKIELVDSLRDYLNGSFNNIVYVTPDFYEEYKNNIGNDGVNRIANEMLMKKLLDFLRQNNTIK